jgi:hypothetical protein
MDEVQKEEIVSGSHTASSESCRVALTKFSSPRHEDSEAVVPYKPQMLEKERAHAHAHTHTHVCVYVYIYVYIYIYIYIYIYK